MSSRMNPRGLTVLVGLLAAGSMAPPALAAGSASKGFQAPTPVLRTLANGLTVAVFEDDRLPLVQIQLVVPAGSAHESSGEGGVANLTFRMLSQGTASRTVMVFDGAVQALGGSLGGSVSREFATVTGAFLAGDMEAGLELIADAVLNPLFDEGRLASIKNQIAAARLAAARQDPTALADDHLWGAVYRDHPYGRPPLGAPRALNALGVAQVRAFHRSRYRPDQALLAIAGDVTAERALKAAEDLFGSWGGRATDTLTATLPRDPGRRVRIVDVPGLARAQLRLGALGPSGLEADVDPLTIAADWLASGTEPVLRVGVSALRSAGLISIASSSPVDSAGQEVARMRAALARGLAEPPAAGALDEAKRRIAGRFTLQLDTHGGLIAQWMAAAIHGGAGHPMGDHADRIRSLAGDAVRAALSRHVTPDQMVLVALGPADRLRPQLKGFGPVEIVPAEAAAEVIELPSTARTPPSAEQLAKGRALAAQAAAAHGGLERLRVIKDSTAEGDVVMTPATGEKAGNVLMVRKDPDRFLFAITIAGMKTTQALSGDGGWTQAGNDPAMIEDLDSTGVGGLRAASRSDLRQLLLAAADPQSRVAWRGRERRDGQDMDVLEVVSADGMRRLLFLDAESHRLVAMEQNDRRHSMRRIYRDLRKVGGVWWPFNEERLLDGQRTMTFAWSRVAFNTGVTDAQFVMPGSKSTSAAKRPRPR